jgi:hypothetical protein
MTEAPDEYPDVPADNDDADAADQGVEGLSEQGDDELTTGDPRVDEVLTSMDALHHLPVSEHAGVFESAHEGLRAALEPDGQPDRQPA